MRNLFIFLFLFSVIVLGSVTSLLVKAHTAEAPFVVPLAMGSTNIPVGFVKVWNDDDNLYVQFEIDLDSYPSYLMEETHLEVSTSPLSWSAPGSWSYSHPNVYDSVDLYTIPLGSIDGGVSPGDIVYLMAHASICDEESDDDESGSSSSDSCEHVGSAYGDSFKGSFNYTIQGPESPSEMPVLNISKTGSVLVSPGKTYLYTIVVTNGGNDTAYNVTVVDQLPDGVAPVDTVSPGTPAGAYDNAENKVIWSLGDMGIGAVQIITLEILIDSDVVNGTQLLNNVTVYWGNSTGGIFSDHDDFVSTVVSIPLIAIDKVGPTLARPGGEVNYVIGVENIGNSTAYNVTLIDSLPTWLTLVSSTPNATLIAPNTFKWVLPELDSGVVVHIYISAIVDVDTPNGTLANNTVSVTWMDFEGQPYGPLDSYWLTLILTAPEVRIIKTGPMEAPLNETIEYVIKVSNVGGSTAYNVTIVDKIPDGFQYIDSLPTGVYDPLADTVTWVIPVIGSSDDIFVSLWLKTPSNISGQCILAVNNATVTWEDNEGGTYGPSWHAFATTLCRAPLLEIVKYGSSEGYINDTLVFYVNVTNIGGSSAIDVMVTDYMPLGLDYLDSDPLGTYDVGSRTITWSLGTLMPGETVTLTIWSSVSVIEYDGVIATNIAGVNYTDPQTQKRYGPLIDLQPVTLYKDPYDDVYKICPTTALPGSTIEYTIMLENPTLTDLYGVNLTDYLPSIVVYISSSPPGIYDPLSHAVKWTNLTILANGNVIFNITVLVPDNVTPGVDIENYALSEWQGGSASDTCLTYIESPPPPPDPEPPIVGGEAEIEYNTDDSLNDALHITLLTIALVTTITMLRKRAN